MNLPSFRNFQWISTVDSHLWVRCASQVVKNGFIMASNAILAHFLHGPAYIHMSESAPKYPYNGISDEKWLSYGALKFRNLGPPSWIFNFSQKSIFAPCLGVPQKDLRWYIDLIWIFPRVYFVQYIIIHLRAQGMFNLSASVAEYVWNAHSFHSGLLILCMLQCFRAMNWRIGVQKAIFNNFIVHFFIFSSLLWIEPTFNWTNSGIEVIKILYTYNWMSRLEFKIGWTNRMIQKNNTFALTASVQKTGSLSHICEYCGAITESRKEFRESSAVPKATEKENADQNETVKYNLEPESSGNH